MRNLLEILEDLTGFIDDISCFLTDTELDYIESLEQELYEHSKKEKE